MMKILIPVDFSDFSDRAIEEGKKMAEAFDSKVVILYVVGRRLGAQRLTTIVDQAQTTDPYTKQEIMKAEERLAAYKESFGGMKDKVETQVLHGIVADEIIKMINNTEIDFVIIGSHGIGSALYRTLNGSITNKVVHHSNKPVLVIM